MVDASFSQIAPGTGVGTIDPLGNVSFRTQLRVDLHLVINGGALIQDCFVSPVSIGLDSVAPWDPETGLVTLRDPDFTVPPTVAEDPHCNGLVATPINDLLAGGGHSLTMIVQGDLELPPPVGCPTATELTMSSDGSSLGEPVTFDATVVAAPDDRPECDGIEAGDVPPGSVEFLAGDTQLGVVDLDEFGNAQLVSSDMVTGTHDVTARYRAVPPYSASRSTAVPHTVVARPTVSIDAPPSFVLGAPPAEFDVVVDNSALGRDVTNGRLDVTIEDASSTLYTLERKDGASWVPVPLPDSTVTSGVQLGAAMPAGGVEVPAGESFTQRYRLRTTGGIGSFTLTFELVPVDPDAAPPVAAQAPTATALARASVDAIATTETRVDPTFSLFVLPHTVRQGMAVTTQPSLYSPDFSPPQPQGTLTVFLDGKQVPIRDQTSPPETGYQMTLPVRDDIGQGTWPKFILPPDTPTGTREVTVKYSGDAFFKPALRTRTITVLPARGVVYECTTSNLLFTDNFNVNVELGGNLPAAVRAGEPVPIRQLDVDLFADRGDTTISIGGFFFGPTPVVTPESGLDGFTVADLVFSQGTGTADTVDVNNGFMMDDSTRPVDPAPDLGIGFTGERADLTFAGAPGEVVPVALEGIELLATFFGGLFTIGVSCAPLDAPATLGPVTVAGTSLSVDAPAPAREGDPVTLRAVAAPAGTPGVVEFRDGDTSLAVVPVDSTGTATHRIPSLDPGEYSFTARFTAASALVNSVSVAVPLTVLPELDCEAFAEEGSGGVVRLVYMELLRRCPDQAGFDYWVGRLDGGTSAERFARTIAATPEAVGVVVDDAYLTMLGRPADTPGKAFWVNRMRTGSGRYDQLLAQLGASPEFWTQAGSTNSGFVTRVYEQLLHRSPDQRGLDFWVGRLDAGTPRGTLIVQLANLDEPLGAIVVASYDEILGRSPQGSERGDGIDHLRATGDRSGLYAELIGRPEFSTRAGTFPNPED